MTRVSRRGLVCKAELTSQGPSASLRP